VLGGWPASRLLAREDSRVLSLSPARSLWRALGRAGEEVLEMRMKCGENVKEEEEEW
jgi:hypothetical protein